MRKNISILLLATFAVFVAIQHAEAQQFEPVVYYRTPGTGGNENGAVSADFNHDSWPDLAMVETTANRAFIFLNDRHGSFNTSPIPLRPNTLGLATSDLNEDGRTDLIAMIGSPGASGSIEVLLGNGDGTFTRGNIYRVGQAPMQMVVRDFNGDGHADLAVANKVAGGVMVFMGDGHGSLKAPALYRGVESPLSITGADVNKDGHPDLLVAGLTGTLAVLLNNGDGTFANGSAIPIAKDALSMTVGDLNHDGNFDIVISAKPMNVLLGNGDGTFGPVVEYIPISNDPRGILIADFNLDGNPDVLLTTLQNGLGLYYGNGDGTLQDAVPVPLDAGGGNASVAGDFDKDGAPDVAVNTNSGRTAVFMNAQ